MLMFRPLGTRRWFRVWRVFVNAAGIQSVHGITFDGDWQTVARVADVIDVSPAIVWC